MTLHKQDVLFGVIAVAVVSILGALYLEHFQGLDPCMLCLWQRKPYYVALGFGALWLLLQRYHAIFTVIFMVIFAVSVGLGVYHAGAEYGFWLGPASCGGAKPMVINAGDLLKSMNATVINDCSKVAFHFLGLSLAMWNVVVSLGVVLSLAYSLFFLRVRAYSFHID